jgi:hypothetical protein
MKGKAKLRGGNKRSLLPALAMVLSACVSQSYWDAQIDSLCKKDGGITIYERVRVSAEDYRRLGGIQGTIPVPTENTRKPGYPFVARTLRTVLSDGDPRVSRTETIYYRVADGKALARLVRYVRVGGDLPVYDHPSAFSCPDAKSAAAAERSIFLIEGFTQ